MANEGGRQDMKAKGQIYEPIEYNTNKFYAKNTERLWTSWLVPLIVVAHIAVFVVVMFINNCPNKEDNGFVGSCVAKFLGRFSFQPLKDNPLFGPSSSTLTKMGALEFYKIVHRHQVWRLITSMWLHAGLIHLLANVLSLAFIGIRLEQQFGFVRVGIIYLLSGLGGNILSCIFLQGSVSVGASYALSGLLGAMLSELITNWTLYSDKVAALITLIFMIAINLALGIFPHVGNFGHIGGLLSGFLLGFVLLLRPKFGWVDSRLLPEKAHVKPKYKAHQYIFGVVGLVLLIAGFAVSLVVLFKSEHGKDLCSWCHNLSCVHTSKWSCDG